MGFGVVVMESALSSRLLGRRSEAPMLASLSRAMVLVLGFWIVVRVADLGFRGRLGLAFTAEATVFWFWLEMALALGAMAMLMVKSRAHNLGWLFQAAVLLVLGGAVYRFSTYLMAFNPGDNWSYFPSIPEMFVTIGFVAFEVLAYIYLIKRFPILAGAEKPAPHPS
jgi:Ni/Fe-hydrogenase subunit HybB-like protein